MAMEIARLAQTWRGGRSGGGTTIETLHARRSRFADPDGPRAMLVPPRATRALRKAPEPPRPADAIFESIRNTVNNAHATTNKDVHDFSFRDSALGGPCAPPCLGRCYDALFSLLGYGSAGA